MKLKNGELNKLIDAVFHPLFKKHKAFIIVDGIAHAVAERDLNKSIVKFVHYNLSKLLEDI